MQSMGSPKRHVDFQRGNSKVVSSLTLSPRASLLRRRPCATPQKYRNAQQQSRKPSNPILKTSLNNFGTPQLDPPTVTSQEGKVSEDDEWQDLDALAVPETIIPADIKPPSLPKSSVWETPKRPSPKPAPSPPNTNFEQASLRPEEQTNDYKDTETFTGSNKSSTASFFGFSPSASRARFMRKLEIQSHRFRPSNWGNYSNEETTFSTRPASDQNKRGRLMSFWLDPTTPGLLALYLQVGFNLAMVAALIYAIAMFYLTIRNDVNLKVEEYSVDIIDQIAKCSFEYLRNGCEPSKRVPAIEAACQQWERCMQRDPKEVGRAKVSAETFGVIIEAFLNPIGLKSMLFLIGVFAGSFLLVNAVFASRIGPRYSGNHQQSSIFHNQQLGMGATAPQQPHSSAQHYPSQMSFQRTLPEPSFIYSPSPRLSSPRQRHSVHATLHSSPIHHQPFANYPY